MGNNYTNYYYISTAGSLLSDMVIKFLLRSNTSSSTYTKILNQILSYKTIKEISEELIEEFCQNILTTNELMAQIMKLIEKNF